MIGFCIACQRDVSIDSNRRCTADGSPAIGPSYGSKDQKWINGAWSPEIARPDGYRYKPKVYGAQVIAAPVSDTCAQCDLTYSYRPRGGDAPRYCSPRCKGAATNARRREARAS